MDMRMVRIGHGICRIAGIAAGLLFALLAAKTDAAVLWEIGKPDADYREFAIAGKYREYSARFSHDVLFTVGKSRTMTDWPFIQPGPGDNWAGSGTHPFRIEFDLKAAPKTPLLLRLFLVDVQAGGPTLEVDVNGRKSYRLTPYAGRTDNSLITASAGRQQSLALPLPAGLFRAGRNRIAITVVAGSWVLYDALSLEDAPGDSAQPRISDLAATVAQAADGNRVARVTLRNQGGEGALIARLDGGSSHTVRLEPGQNSFDLPLSASVPAGPMQVTVSSGGRAQRARFVAPGTVWQIGTKDGDYSELAIAGNYAGYSRQFPSDVTYIVGQSKPETDWPFIQPGPADGWAGEKAHPFTVKFNVDAPAGAYRLNVDVVDTQPNAPGPELEIAINGGHRYTIPLPNGGSDKSLTDPKAGHAYHVDLPFPSRFLKAGANSITLTIRKGSWLLYDALSLEQGIGLPETPMIAGIDAQSTMLFQRVGGKLKQAIRVTVHNAGVEGEAEGVRIEKGEARRNVPLKPGENTFYLLSPAFEKAGTGVVVANAGTHEERVTFVGKAERRWKVYVGASAHTDIGYTDFQERVFERHNDNTAAALRYSEQIPGYKWNLEVGAQAMLFKRRGPQAFSQLVERIKDGRIGLGGLYLNMLTGLCSGEELATAFTRVQDIADANGIKSIEANLTDVPTAAGTMPMLMKQAGIRYFIQGSNEWDAPPFRYDTQHASRSPIWWEALDGTKLLTLLNYRYAIAGDLGMEDDAEAVANLLPDWLRGYERPDYPYDAAYVYGVFLDNRPTDARFAEIAKAWNAKWEYPKIVLCRADEFMSYIETNYGKVVPTVRGDYGAYWEDGAASSALETAVSRKAKAQLDAAERWSALAKASPSAATEIDQAWENLLFYDEHTWGAADSISNPEGEQTRRQWAYKANFAAELDRLSTGLQESATGMLRKMDADPRKWHNPSNFRVFNPHSWSSDILVSMESKGIEPADVLVAGSYPAELVRSQEHSKIVFVARSVPPLGWQTYSLSASHNEPRNDGLLTRGTDEWTWETPDFRLRIDPKTGALSSLFDKKLSTEWVDGSKGQGIDQFLYVLGGDGGKVSHPETPVPDLHVGTHSSAVVSLVENGWMRAALHVERTGPDAPPTDTYIVFGPDRRLDFVNVVHKSETLAKEAGYFAFPIRLQKPEAARAFIELPYGVMELEKDQATGGCRDWYCTNSFMAVTDGAHTAYVATPHAPLLTSGDIFRGRLHGPGKKIDGNLYSYVLNNYWGTNYKASQGGDMVFAYSLRLDSGPFDPVMATRFGWERLADMPDPRHGTNKDIWKEYAQDTVPAGNDAGSESLLRLSDGPVVLGGLHRKDGKLTARLYNPSMQAARTTLTLPTFKIQGAWRSDLVGRPLEKLTVSGKAPGVQVTVPARGLTTVVWQVE